MNQFWLVLDSQVAGYFYPLNRIFLFPRNHEENSISNIYKKIIISNFISNHRRQWSLTKLFLWEFHLWLLTEFFHDLRLCSPVTSLWVSVLRPYSPGGVFHALAGPLIRVDQAAAPPATRLFLWSLESLQSGPNEESHLVPPALKRRFQQ
jgi:hypothetical protein